jgi:gentisate 1,2-dioxygenase
VRWPWRTARAALAAMAATAPRRAPVVLRHVNPRTGEYPLKTMGSEVRWLRAGEETRAERRTASEVVHVIEGQGESQVGDRTLDWQAGDVFVVPPWQRTTHRNRSGGAPACLFHLNDEPAIRALGLWLEEADE